MSKYRFSQLSSVIGVLFLILPLHAQQPDEIRIVAPDALSPDSFHLFKVEARYDGSNEWKRIDEKHLQVSVNGDGAFFEDPSGLPVNPFTVATKQAGEVDIEVKYLGQTSRQSCPVQNVEPRGTFRAVVNAKQTRHRFDGMGAGVLFYDNQFDITQDDDLLQWCFSDVRAQFLHILIRPRFEDKNDNDDWQNLDLEKFDFQKAQRVLRVASQALVRNPDLKIYASLYSPPAWMKTNNSTSGKGSLKDGLKYRQELAEYFFAFLKYAASKGIEIDYLAFFNEPDWPHGQDGMHMPQLPKLADTFGEIAHALEHLIERDSELTAVPKYIFADTLGAGSITRAGKKTEQLAQRKKILDKVAVWGVHDYWNQSGYWLSRFQELRDFAPVGNRPIWMTEWAQRFPRGDLASGVEYGTNMLNALRLGAQAWMVFEWCHPCQNQSGLISTDWSAQPPRQRYWRSKAYYFFQQLTNSTPVGSYVIDMNGRSTTASDANENESVVEYVALRNNESVILHLCNSSAYSQHMEINLRMPKQVSKLGGVRGLQTGPTANSAPYKLESIESKNNGGSKLQGILPANSLVSLILSYQS